MIICLPHGVEHFIGDQDYDANGLRYTIKLGSCAFAIKDASIHLTRQEESACASTQGPDCAIPFGWEAAPTSQQTARYRVRLRSLRGEPGAASLL